MDANLRHSPLAHAATLIAVLAEDCPGDLVDAYRHAISEGPKWEAQIAASLRRIPRAADILRHAATIA